MDASPTRLVVEARDHTRMRLRDDSALDLEREERVHESRAAIADEDLSGHPLRLFHADERDEVRHVLGSAGPPHRAPAAFVPLLDRRLYFGRETDEHTALDRVV